MLEQALRRYWHPVAVSADVTAEPRQVRLLGEPIVLYRDAAGPVALADRCVHRGAALSGGCIRDGRLMCPYHGWQYDRSGKVAFIPALGPDGTIPSGAKVARRRVREQHGAVWVALEAPAADPPPWPDDDWNDPARRVFLVGTWRWQASAARMVENAADFSHFNFVHAGFTELADGPFIKPHEITLTGDGMTYAYDDGVLVRSYTLHLPFALHDRKSVVAAAGGITWSEQGDSRAGDVTTISSVASPVDQAETLIFVYLSRNHSLDVADADFAVGFDEIMEQDRTVVEAQDPVELPLDPRAELHLKVADGASLVYRRLLRALAAARA
ncbi:MAG: aromatic ring-hydroxylating dioxygenase subunit alpha [Acidimicrobiia bacterium]|nr:aromatic ring-hydroxylating dioxygenase subunit alpha [Acidimicrobiia bacterium]